MREKLPDGFVDHLRRVALESAPGELLIVRMGETTYSLYTAESFVVKLILKLEELFGNTNRFTVTIIGNRREKDTGQLIPPRFDVQEYF